VCKVPQQQPSARAPALPPPRRRFVTGTCPKCAYLDARGDQCDGCGNLLNPTELIGPKCKITGTTPVVRSTTHIFLDLPQLSPKLQEYITSTSQLGGWSSNCVQVGGSRLPGDQRDLVALLRLAQQQRQHAGPPALTNPALR
jgi:hypothetical protein